MIYSTSSKQLASLYLSVRLAGSHRCWFVKKYCWLVYVREKYYSDKKFTIVYDEPQPACTNLAESNHQRSGKSTAQLLYQPRPPYDVGCYCRPIIAVNVVSTTLLAA